MTACHARAGFAQAVTSRAGLDSATVDKAHTFAAHLRTLLDSQNVEGLTRLMAAPSSSAHRADPTLMRFLGPAQIILSSGTQVVGATSALSVSVVSQDVWVLTGVDDSSPRVGAGARRVWTALVNMRESVPRLLYLHVSPPK